MGMEVWAERVARSWESGVVEGEGIGMLYLVVSFDDLQDGSQGAALWRCRSDWIGDTLERGRFMTNNGDGGSFKCHKLVYHHPRGEYHSNHKAV